VRGELSGDSCYNSASHAAKLHAGSHTVEAIKQINKEVVMSSEQTNQQGVVVIGAGLAGWHVIDAIRSKDKDVPITLITADNADRYHKPMLTMAISQNKRAADLVRASGADAASDRYSCGQATPEHQACKCRQ